MEKAPSCVSFALLCFPLPHLKEEMNSLLILRIVQYSRCCKLAYEKPDVGKQGSLEELNTDFEDSLCEKLCIENLRGKNNHGILPF